MSDIIRILRVLEYTGPREAVEKQVALSLHGEKHLNNGVVIRAATVGAYPELLKTLEPPKEITEEEAFKLVQERFGPEASTRVLEDVNGNATYQIIAGSGKVLAHSSSWRQALSNAGILPFTR